MPEPDKIESLLTPDQRIGRAKAANVPNIYLNGFQTALTSADVVLVAETNGEPVALLNLSFTTAKTLAKALADTIALLETKSGREMLTTHDFDAMMRGDEA